MLAQQRASKRLFFFSLLFGGALAILLSMGDWIDNCYWISMFPVPLASAFHVSNFATSSQRKVDKGSAVFIKAPWTKIRLRCRIGGGDGCGYAMAERYLGDKVQRSFPRNAVALRCHRPCLLTCAFGSAQERSLLQGKSRGRARSTPLRHLYANLDSTSVRGEEQEVSANELIGDDSAYFSFREQSLLDWVKFTAATGFVLVSLSYLWFLPEGPLWGDVFLRNIQSALGTTDPAITVFTMLAAFAFAHSGLAGLRQYGEEVIGARAWRVIFACVSLPLALSCISYFVNHAHEGQQLWDLTHVPGLHTLCFISNFVSFLFLYPSSFNLLEVAAIDKPQLHLWETGVMRITRHPQAIGQILWCSAHTLWLGSSTALAASTVLIAHHLYSVWHGDRRLKSRHGETFDRIKERTSVVPFAAIIEGRQRLPDDYYKEFLRIPYAAVVGGTLAAYLAHPFMLSGAALLHW